MTDLLTNTPERASGGRARRWGVGIGCAAAIVAGALGAHPVAAAGTPVQASAESYIAGGSVTLLGQATPIVIGPVEPAAAYVPGVTGNDNASVVACGTPGGTACVATVAQNAAVIQDTAKATLTSSPTTDCAPNIMLPAGFVTGTLTGANGCASATGLGLLSVAPSLPPGGPATPLITATAVNAQSLTQSCTAPSEGHVNIVGLTIGGTPITIPTGPGGVIAPNTVVAVAALGVTIIANEQTPDSTGHGLTVNALDIVLSPTGPLTALANGQVIVAHTHSQALCDTGTVVPPPGPGPSGTKTDASPTVPQGGTQTYTLSVAHGTGGTPAAACVLSSVVDTLPPGFTYVSSTGNLGVGAPTVGTAPVTGQQTLTFTAAAGLPATPDPLQASIVVSVGANVAPGFYANTATIFSTCGQTNFTDVPGTQVTGPAPGPGIPAPKTGAGLPMGEGLLLVIAGLGLATAGVIVPRRRQLGLSRS